jgi:LysR family transcriptional regulator, hydrogen peroxide-inducible genes activator
MGRWSPRLVTLRQLQYVLAVAEYGSFRRAAEACAVAQPSLSSQIAQLESAIGIRLFERLPRRVVVTEAGAAVIDRARRTLLAADDLVALADRARDPLAGTLRIGVIPTVAPYLLPEIAPALRAEFPRLQLLWAEEKTLPLLRSVSSGELDAGILALESDLGELESEPLGRDAFLLAVPKGHALARPRRRARARPEELEGETVLLLDDGHCFRDQALAVCQRVGAEEASVRATSLSTLAQMVAGGVGVTLLPSIAVATENRARGLVIRSFGPRGPARTLALAWRKTAPVGVAARALAQRIRVVVARLADTAVDERP